MNKIIFAICGASPKLIVTHITQVKLGNLWDIINFDESTSEERGIYPGNRSWHNLHKATMLMAEVFAKHNHILIVSPFNDIDKIPEDHWGLFQEFTHYRNTKKRMVVTICVLDSETIFSQSAIEEMEKAGVCFVKNIEDAVKIINDGIDKRSKENND